MHGNNLIEAAAAELERRRRRRLLDKVKQPGYTPGTGFNMAVLQQKADTITACTPRCLIWNRHSCRLCVQNRSSSGDRHGCRLCVQRCISLLHGSATLPPTDDI